MMPVVPVSLLARLCAADYTDSVRRMGRVLGDFEERGMHATVGLVADARALICSGSNDAWDWVRNFRFVPWWWEGRLWHRGFLAEAKRVVMWAEKQPQVDIVTGHSRGAAVAQILSLMLGVPAVTFAAPRPLWFGSQPEGSHRVVNFCILQDPVAAGPVSRMLGFRHVGRVEWLDVPDVGAGEAHRIETYVQAVGAWEQAGG
jgi:hypothetical protein